MLIESDYLWRSVINPDVGNFPMANRDDAVGWARIPAYEAGGALGGLDYASMSGGGAWVLNPNTDNPDDGVGAAHVHELGRPDQGPPRRRSPGDGA